MNWTFFLDGTLIDEPIGFADIVLKIKRDDQWHGIFFEATTSDLQFYGDAADYLMNKKRMEGFQAEVTFSAEVDCPTGTEVFTGKLDFRQYKERCGDTCFVIIPVEQDGCTMTLRNRYDQKVDLSDNKAFDKLTVLPNYNGLNFGMELAAQEVKLGDTAEANEQMTVTVSDEPIWNNGTNSFIGYIAPVYGNVRNASLGEFNTTDIFMITETGSTQPPYPSFPVAIGLADLVTENQCQLSNLTINLRHKGTVNIQQSGVGATQFLTLKLFLLPNGQDPTIFSNWILEYDNPFYAMNFDGPVNFDVSATVPPFIVSPGDFLYYGVWVGNGNRFNIESFVYTQDIESFFSMEMNSVCPPTNATVSLIHETLSRVAEAITDRCLVVKSDYYGRTDSEPYEAAEDGCGSLRVLTSGLRLRNDITQKHFLSMKDAFESLNAIDNIGMGIEQAGIYDPLNLRIEQVEYFYQDVEIARHLNIPKAEFSLQSGMVYSLVKIGYQRWETENVNGLDEFNSNKEFRTSLKSINNTLDQTSGFVAGGYPIEKTRQQTFAKTGAADTGYDNDTFIICVRRDYAAYGNYEVEQGNIDSGANFYSPATAYNWRIRPLYNLIRWWKSISQSYVNLLNTASKLFFSAGVGNLLAQGQLLDACDVARGVLPENHDLAQGDVELAKDYLPIWKPELMNYTYPMSLSEYNAIKAGPKGYIYAECGSGPGVKGFIKDINYKLAKGEADITLKLKWV